jgi:putative oxidoreductase
MAERLAFTKDIPLLLMRLVLAYGFWGPAMMKWKNMDGIVNWFAGMGIPFPTVNAYLSASTEVAGSILLFLGLATRIISIPLMVVMLVAIFTVHIHNGFEAGANGFEIPLYYLIMLITLLVYGPGRFSVSGLLRKKMAAKA